VNIVRHYRIFIILALMGLFAFSCGENDTAREAETETVGEVEEAPADSIAAAKKEIQEMLTEMVDRVKEGDKTVLYEMEFDYYTDSVSLSEYMEINRVLNYKYDTLGAIRVDTVVVYGDSAMVGVTVIYESVVGGTTERPYAIKAYKYNGEWLRPYLSNYAKELEYQERVRAYEEAIRKND